MAKGGRSKTVLVLDDEPEYQQWVGDFIEAKGLKVRYVTKLDEAIQAISAQDFRLLIVDMNVPAGSGLEPGTVKKHPLVTKYPGLVLAIEARNMGYGAHSVIAYTVHDDDAAADELNRLHCRYVLKGRPEAFKRVVMSSLAPPQVVGQTRVKPTATFKKGR